MEFDVRAFERIDRDAWLSIAADAPPSFAQSIGLEVRRLGGATLPGKKSSSFRFLLASARRSSRSVHGVRGSSNIRSPGLNLFDRPSTRQASRRHSA